MPLPLPPAATGAQHVPLPGRRLASVQSGASLDPAYDLACEELVEQLLVGRAGLPPAACGAGIARARACGVPCGRRAHACPLASPPHRAMTDQAAKAALLGLGERVRLQGELAATGEGEDAVELHDSSYMDGQDSEVP